MGSWLARPSRTVPLAASSISAPLVDVGHRPRTLETFGSKTMASLSDPDGRTLTAFLNKVLANGAINGTWKLETIDTTTSAPTTPASVDFWTLNLSTGMKPDLDVQVPGTLGLVVAGSLTTPFPTASAASPIGISPGVVMASDNTLGSFSPYQGRIYAAFVGYYNVMIDGVKNPTDNTDIFLTYSDDGGRTWSPAGRLSTTMHPSPMVVLRRAENSAFERYLHRPRPVPAGDRG